MPENRSAAGGVQIVTKKAVTDADFDIAKDLILEYSRRLGIDFSFQDFEKEIREFPGEYSEPAGAILLGFVRGKVGGCVALKPLGEKDCEMKRLYVKPEFRGISLGYCLVEDIISEARRIGYRSMKLDTLDKMRAARALYAKFGFAEIPAYRHNPLKGARFMQLYL